MILDLVLIGLVITLEPIPLTAFILVLGSKRGVRKGAAFIFGWLVSLGVVVVITLLITRNNPPRPNTAPSLAALAAKIAIGSVLLCIAYRRWRTSGSPKKPKTTPSWQTGIDNMSAWYAMGLALLIQPWGLVAAGVATIVEMKLTSWQSYISLIFFCFVATGIYLALEILAALRPERAQTLLTSIRLWIDANTDQVIIIVSLVLGLWLVGKSVYLIVG